MHGEVVPGSAGVAGLSDQRSFDEQRARVYGIGSSPQRASAAQESRLMSERMAKADADRDNARKEAGTAREEAAKLSGQIAAMQAQASELVRALSERKDTPSATASGL